MSSGAPRARGGSERAGARPLLTFYMWVAGLSLLLVSVLTPPFQVPDEPQHFYRSYQLSRLEVRPEVRDGQAGAVLPRSIPSLVESHLGTLAHHARRQVPQRPLAETLQDLGRPLAADDQAFVEFTGSAVYAPLAYVPQAVAIAAGRALGLGPLALLYAARAANALAAFALIAWSLARLGRVMTTGVLLAVLPMTLFVLASASPDALTIAGGFIVAALLARFFEQGVWQSRDTVAWVGGGLLLCTVKVVYFPLMFAGLAAVMAARKARRPEHWQGLRSQALGALAVLLVTAFWFWWRATGVSAATAPPGVDAAGQLAALRQSPLLLLKIVPRTLYQDGSMLAESTIGQLGWLNVAMPAWVRGCAYLALLLSLFVRSDATTRTPAAAPRWPGSVWVLALAFVVVELIVVAHYIAWTPVGAYSAQGVQGRYLLPLLPVVALAVSWRVPAVQFGSITPALKTLFAALCLALPLATFFTLVTAYSLF